MLDVGGCRDLCSSVLYPAETARKGKRPFWVCSTMFRHKAAVSCRSRRGNEYVKDSLTQQRSRSILEVLYTRDNDIKHRENYGIKMTSNVAQNFPLPCNEDDGLMSWSNAVNYPQTHTAEDAPEHYDAHDLPVGQNRVDTSRPFQGDSGNNGARFYGAGLHPVLGYGKHASKWPREVH